MESLAALRATIPQQGRVDWIGVSEKHRAPITAVQVVEARVGSGLEGDHHKGGSKGTRQVTLIQAEYLPVVATLVGRDDVEPEQLRRNIVVSGISLYTLKNRRFRIGSALFEGTGYCPPCGRMEENLGPGGYQAMRGHGGITARVLESGTIRRGDPVRAEPVAAEITP